MALCALPLEEFSSRSARGSACATSPLLAVSVHASSLPPRPWRCVRLAIRPRCSRRHRSWRSAPWSATPAASATSRLDGCGPCVPSSPIASRTRTVRRDMSGACRVRGGSLGTAERRGTRGRGRFSSRPDASGPRIGEHDDAHQLVEPPCERLWDPARTAAYGSPRELRRRRSSGHDPRGFLAPLRPGAPRRPARRRRRAHGRPAEVAPRPARRRRTGRPARAHGQGTPASPRGRLWIRSSQRRSGGLVCGAHLDGGAGDGVLECSPAGSPRWSSNNS